MIMITISDLNFSYTGKEPFILENVNIKINRGSYTAIMGDNGSAKTTLIKLMLNLIKPVSGSVELGTKKIGYLPQNSKSINSQFPITVYEFLKCHAKILKLKDKNLIDENLKKFDLLGKKNCLLSNLSGGQVQKVLIARALLGKPELLVLDEPSTGLDMKSQDEIYSIFKHLNQHEGVTIIAVEHNLHAAFKNATDMLSIENCKVKFTSLKKDTTDINGGRYVRI